MSHESPECYGNVYILSPVFTLMTDLYVTLCSICHFMLIISAVPIQAPRIAICRYNRSRSDDAAWLTSLRHCQTLSNEPSPRMPIADGDQVESPQKASAEPSKVQKVIDTIYWTPPWCRWGDKPPSFTIWHNILYASACAFTAANLYYSHPILNVLARDFHTTQGGISTIPTLAQAGDATGLLFILPLADYFPRRRFALTLVSFSALFWIGLCITNSFTIFLVLTYLSALFTGATQIMLPLVSELSTPENRAFNLSIVATGPTLGILLARILSGIVTNYTSWRNIYWLALGLQGSVLLALWLFMPDYPTTNPTHLPRLVKMYPKILWSIIMLYPKHPVLVQAALLSFCTFFALTSYWTTLTFLLAGAPYHYNSTDIGLFGLIGIATMLLGPLFARYIIRPLGEPLYTVAIGKTVSLIGTITGTYTGTRSAAGPAIQALMLDCGLTIVQISNRMAIHSVDPLAMNRVNTAFVSVMYLGQLAGVKAGNDIYENHGGWIASGSLSVGVLVFSLVIILLRGPHETGWIGWRGGWRLGGKAADAESSQIAVPMEMDVVTQGGIIDEDLHQDGELGREGLSEEKVGGEYVENVEESAEEETAGPVPAEEPIEPRHFGNEKENK